MSSISGLRESAKTTIHAVKEKFDAVKALDGNPLFDLNNRPGEVQVVNDSWTSTCSFEKDGSPLAFRWKSTQTNEHARQEADASTIEDTYAIERDNAQTRFSYEYFGPGYGGEFSRTSKTIAILDNGNGELLDCVHSESF